MIHLKETIGFVLLLALVNVFAEKLTFNDSRQWRSENAEQPVVIQDNIITMDSTNLNCQQSIAVEPERMYTLSLAVKSLLERPAWLMVGFEIFDAKGRQIRVVNVVNNAASFTVVQEDAVKGCMEFRVENAEHWNKEAFSRMALAVGAKTDYSDLPNYTIEILSIDDVKKDDTGWVVSLKSPLPCHLKAGTGIRQHYEGSAFYVRSFNGEPESWVEAEGYNDGIGSIGGEKHKFPPGATHARLIIYNPTQTKCQIKNLTLEIE